MSASDIIQLKKIKNSVNTFALKNSSNRTQLLKINTLENSCHLDEDSELVAPYYFDIPIVDSISDCPLYVEDNISTPVMYKPKLRQTNSFIKNKKLGLISTCCNDKQVYYISDSSCNYIY